MKFRLGRWELDIDPLRTAACFARYPKDAACTCAGCRNFRALGEHAFPVEFRAVATELGIDVTKPAELGHYDEGGARRSLDGWFHLVGNIVGGRDAWRQVGAMAWTADTEPLLGLTGLGFTDRIALLPEAFEDQSVVQLEFQTKVPWVLEDGGGGTP